MQATEYIIGMYMATVARKQICLSLRQHAHLRFGIARSMCGQAQERSTYTFSRDTAVGCHSSDVRPPKFGVYSG